MFPHINGRQNPTPGAMLTAWNARMISRRPCMETASFASSFWKALSPMQASFGYLVSHARANGVRISCSSKTNSLVEGRKSRCSSASRLIAAPRNQEATPTKCTLGNTYQCLLHAN